MKPWHWIIGIASLLVIGAWLLPRLIFGAWVFDRFGGSPRDAVLPDLHYVTLAEFMADVADVDAVAIYDEGPRSGAPTWHVITDPQAAETARFGHFKDRFVDTLVRGHLTNYCTTNGVLQGKTVWALSGGEVVKARVYCARARMDVAELTAIARPAQSIDRNDLTAPQYRALEAQIAASPDLVGAIRSDLRPYSHSCTLTFPYIWGTPDDPRGWMPKRVAEAVEAAMADVMGEGGYGVDYRDGYASTYVMHAAEGKNGVSAEGWPVNSPYVRLHGQGGDRKVPGISVFRPEVRVEGDQTACAAFETLDFSVLVAEHRDADVLAQAWQNGALQPENTGGFYIDLAAVQRASFTSVPSREVTYGLRYFEVQEGVSTQ